MDDSGDDFDIPHEDLASDMSSESDSDSQSQDLDPGRSGQSSRSNTADCFGWIPITRSLNNGWGCKPHSFMRLEIIYYEFNSFFTFLLLLLLF